MQPGDVKGPGYHVLYCNTSTSHSINNQIRTFSHIWKVDGGALRSTDARTWRVVQPGSTYAGTEMYHIFA